MSAPSLPQLLIGHWQSAWPLDAQAALYAAVYGWAVRRRHGRWPATRTLAFLAGIGCVVASLQSGIDGFDGRLLSVHMVQHMLLALIAPWLLLYGRPQILALRTLPIGARRELARALETARSLTSPPICLSCFYAAVLLTHLPWFYDATLRDGTLHALEHVAYLLAGLALWWPLLDGDPVSSQRLGGLGRLIYVLAAMVPMAIVGAYLNRHASLVYPGYAQPGRALGVSALSDQAQAGAIMWVAGGMVMVTAGLWASMTALLAEERRQQARDAHRPADATRRNARVDPGALP